MSTVYKVRFEEGTSSSEVMVSVNDAYNEILQLDTPVIIDTQFQLITKGDNVKFYSVMIRYSYDVIIPP